MEDNFGLSNNAEEEMWAIGFEGCDNIRGIFKVGQGNASKTMNNVAGIFKRLLLTNSTSFVIFHNHPSGLSEPTEEDISTTSFLQTLGFMMEIVLIDHIVVAKDGTASTANILKERGEWDWTEEKMF